MAVASEAALRALQRTVPDATVIASDLVKAGKNAGVKVPLVQNLTGAMTAILPESHIKGAGVLKLSLLDPAFTLLDGEFFSPGGDGKLAPLQINYPKGSKYWWRTSTLSPKNDGSLDLTLIDKMAWELQNAHGPYKANRDSMTRAEFLKYVARHGSPDARFHSAQLDKRQPIDPVVVSGVSPAAIQKAKHTSGTKAKGLGANYKGLSVMGQPMGKRQAENVNIILNVGHKYGANETAMVAAIYAAIWESNLEQYAQNPNYWGVFSGSRSQFSQFDTVGMATAFFLGGKGFQGGGAIAMSHHTNNPIEIAVRVEVPSIWPDNAYAKESGYIGDTRAVQEAKDIVQAGGGAAGGGGGSLGPGTVVEIVQPYYFQIGTSNNRNESDWDGSVRLAGEVNWEYFTDGPDIYYDHEKTLITQKPVAVVRRTDPEVISWDYDWEDRNVATAFNLTLTCEPFQFRAGEVMVLLGFGCDRGSTANQPGKWLIQDAVRQGNSLTTTFTLKQPEAPKNEPAPSASTQTVGGSSKTSFSMYGVASTGGGVGAVVAAARALSAMQLPYIWGGGHSPGALDAAHPAGFDCSGSTCWALHKAGMWAPSYAAVSGDLARSWGQPGQGRQMTIWANASHVFIEFKLPGGHFQLNTSGLGPGPRFGPWGGNGAADARSGQFTPRHWPGT